jgi:hypothetical protein
VVVPLPPRPFLGILDNPLLDNQAVETRDDGGQGNTSGKPPIPERRLARMPDIPTNELGRSWDGGGEVEHKDGQASSVPSSPEGSDLRENDAPPKRIGSTRSAKVAREKTKGQDRCALTSTSYDESPS